MTTKKIRKTAVKKAARSGSKAARAKAPPTKQQRAAKKATRPAPKPATRRPATAAKPKAKAKRATRRPVASAAPGWAPQVSWGALVDSLNARVAIRSVSLAEFLARPMPSLTTLPPPLAPTGNVDTNAPDAQRARRFLSMARACVGDLHGDRPLAARENMARLLLHMAWNGSKLRFRRQGGGQVDDGTGPGRGLIPFEAHRAKDTLIRLTRASADRTVHRLGDLAGLGWPGLVRCALSLPEWAPGGRGAAFPDGHILAGLLERNDQFALYLARAALLLLPMAVPVGNNNHAEYWYKFWRISAPDPAAASFAFRSDADEVDALVDG
ncbi:hypothetical protein [Reyranella sp. CPCC 100927]|uniref:hypothetical protein n=1 Tax=Reyranella sp. CPCC 100927 TaxID=2599616 RepID=UPI0011B45274|nr:hypothetical protein [Reyranella sp. CPCC 100927]TWT00667.1 hypothetical protein FQU96_32940 [Reyranella sp. CPCC 100927]